MASVESSKATSALGGGIPPPLAGIALRSHLHPPNYAPLPRVRQESGRARQLPEALMLESLLAEGRPLLADGATGTNLFEMGLTSGETPELWNDIHPDRIAALHQSFVDAGADIILTNSFGGNRRRLMLHQLDVRARELNEKAARIARSVAAEAGRPVVVAGSVGPTGDLLAPLGPLTEEEAFAAFVE